MTAQLGRIASLGAVVGTSDAELLAIEQRPPESRPDVLAAFAAAVGALTDRYLVVEGEPPGRRVTGAGVAVLPAEAGVALTASTAELIDSGWCVVTIDDVVVLVRDRRLIDSLQPVVTATRLALQAQRLCRRRSGRRGRGGGAALGGHPDPAGQRTGRGAAGSHQRDAGFAGLRHRGCHAARGRRDRHAGVCREPVRGHRPAADAAGPGAGRACLRHRSGREGRRLPAQ